MQPADLRSWIKGTVFVAIGVLLSMAFHALGAMGSVFLPMHIPVLQRLRRSAAFRQTKDTAKGAATASMLRFNILRFARMRTQLWPLSALTLATGQAFTAATCGRSAVIP